MAFMDKCFVILYCMVGSDMITWLCTAIAVYLIVAVSLHFIRHSSGWTSRFGRSSRQISTLPNLKMIQQINNSSTSESKFPNKFSTACDVVEGHDLTGKTYFITGANCGIGFETARALSKQRAHVIMACRNQKAASEAKERILKIWSYAKVDILKLDLSELKSVEECAHDFNKSNWNLDCLILNAGQLEPLHRVTDDGFEATFQVNHLAHFYLSQLLLPKLKTSAPSRLVVVSSDSHRTVYLGPQDITWQKLSPEKKGNLNFSFTRYAISKFCNILFANEFNQRYAKDGVTANTLHPGMVNTNISRNSKLVQIWFLCCSKFMVIPPENGAATTTYLAAAPEVEGHGGEYYVNCNPVLAADYARNVESWRRLWDLSEEMLNHYRTSDRFAQVEDAGEQIDVESDSLDCDEMAFNYN